MATKYCHVILGNLSVATGLDFGSRSQGARGREVLVRMPIYICACQDSDVIVVLVSAVHEGLS